MGLVVDRDLLLQHDERLGHRPQLRLLPILLNVAQDTTLGGVAKH